MLKIYLRYFLTTLVILGILSACAPVKSLPTGQPIAATEIPSEEAFTPTAQPIHLKVGVFNYISWAPLFIAYEEGYFSEQGLDVELIDFGSQSTEFIPALLSKQLDIAPFYI